jgi:hypothetical protein
VLVTRRSGTPKGTLDIDETERPRILAPCSTATYSDHASSGHRAGEAQRTSAVGGAYGTGMIRPHVRPDRGSRCSPGDPRRLRIEQHGTIRGDDGDDDGYDASPVVSRRVAATGGAGCGFHRRAWRVAGGSFPLPLSQNRT